MKLSLLKSAIVGILAISFVVPAFAQTYNGQQLQGRVTYVPTGTAIDAVLTSPIDSAVARPGDLFSAKIYAPLYVGNDLVLPANTTLEGQITAAEKSGHAGVSGTIGMHLTAAVTPDGTRYPLSAAITAEQQAPLNEDKQGNLHGRSKKAAVATGAARTALWTGAGTLLGIIFAPIVAGAVGAGAIAGVATGGAVGLGSNLWRKGKDVKIPSGTRIQFALDQPMSMSSGIAGAPNYTH
ncbi:MAG: hypothetical protein HY711_07335 [Candidatus Melainabacteria bacterium]|nr:hypothetical protein [Candidatus Melainabacteria bacterium]